MTRAIVKTSLFALLALTLAGCGSNLDNGVASASDFVDVAALDTVKIATITLRSKNSSIAAGASASGRNHGPKALSMPSTSHEADFYTNDDFKYATSTMTVIGHSDTAHSSYYLVNGSTSLGYVYDAATPLESHRAAAKQMLADDYTYLTGLYNQIKGYAGKTAEEAGFTSLKLLYTNIDSTAGYNCTTVKPDGTSTNETNYYITMDKVETGYVFTDVIVREKVTSSSGGISYSNFEFHLLHQEAYSDQVFNLASMSICKAGLDVSSIPATALDTPIA